MSKRLFSPTSPPPAAKRVQKARLSPSAPSPSPPSSKPSGASVVGVDPDAIPSVFDILNIFRSRWFLNKDHLIANVLSAQRDADGRLCWVDFLPPFHTHLVQRALALVPPLCPAAMGKKVLFVFVMEVMDGDGPKPGSLLRTSSGTSLWTGIVTIRIGNRSKWGLPFWDPSGSLLYTSEGLVSTDLA